MLSVGRGVRESMIAAPASAKMTMNVFPAGESVAVVFESGAVARFVAGDSARVEALALLTGLRRRLSQNSKTFFSSGGAFPQDLAGSSSSDGEALVEWTVCLESRVRPVYP